MKNNCPASFVFFYHSHSFCFFDNKTLARSCRTAARIFRNMVSYEDENFFIKASSIDASFGDGTTLPLDTITVSPSTPMGDVILMSSTVDDDRVVRLVLISPAQDWRQNQFYAWKLDNAWMSDRSYKWLHWNVESFTTSEIQVPSNNSVFACESMEFKFSRIGTKHSAFGGEERTKVVLRDVKIGAALSFTTQEKELYRPCLEETCSIIDGATTAGRKGVFDGANGLSRSAGTHVVIVAFGLSLLFGGLLIVVDWVRKRRRTKLYQQINPIEDEEDLQLAEEESACQNSILVETVAADEESVE